MPPTDVAARFFDAIEAGDIDAVAALYAPGLRVWHSESGAEDGRDENLALLRGFAARTVSRRYLDRRVQATDEGFVQQHRLLATAPNGAVLDAAVCLVARVRDGLIERIDEYLDAGAVDAWRAALRVRQEPLRGPA